MATSKCIYILKIPHCRNSSKIEYQHRRRRKLDTVDTHISDRSFSWLDIQQVNVYIYWLFILKIKLIKESNIFLLQGTRWFLLSLVLPLNLNVIRNDKLFDWLYYDMVSLSQKEFNFLNKKSIYIYIYLLPWKFNEICNDTFVHLLHLF
jgi:hypothetical protein